MSYEIFDITDVEIDQPEQLGTKSKFWYDGVNGGTYLFKSIKTIDKFGGEIYRYGEDWAEKIACELAGILEIPHAQYELATHNGVQGVITKNFIVGKGERLSTGNELIEKINAFIPTSSDSVQRLSRVFLIMEKIIKKKPIGFNGLDGIKTASDFFVGYLLLDALISNQDRHVENWGMIETNKGTTHLAPSFDHAASLGRNENDIKREKRLNSKDKGYSIEQYVLKAQSHFYDSNNKRLKILQAFNNSARINPKAARNWLLRLKGVESDMIRYIIDEVPTERMSTVAKDFSFNLIICNKKNLLELLDTF
ncbi:hypothetical protein AAIG33_12900 [Phytobacter ursingii]|uniref:hypothetical protein n=1 Tax=Phytobacter ursingii TaxID=1972431 RepID=UPI0031B77CBB